MPRFRAVFVISGLVVMLMAAVAHPAGAGTIDLGGTVTFAGVGLGGIIDWVGDRGFTAHGSFYPFLPGLCTPCGPGQPINLSARLSEVDLFGGIVTLEGTTYRVGGQIASSLEPRLRLTFGGPTLFAPPFNVAPIVALTTPMSVEGIFAHTGIVEQFGATATTTIMLKRENCGPFSGDCWGSASATYDLTPTPEPATLLLFGTTMAGLGLARWVKRRRTHGQLDAA
jgi:hypothetical protein